MKRLRYLFGLIVIWCAPICATTYFIAPASGGGSDSNNGTSSGTPWLTPNHSVNCGDVILGAAGTYAPFSVFTAPTCVGANNVTWIKCVAFDVCVTSGMTAGQAGMQFGTSYWGVQGWEVDGTTTSGACFLVFPFSNTIIHHILFANDIASGCGGGGFITDPSTVAAPTTFSVDYIALVGNIAYNAAGGSAYCAQGISIYEPAASDSLPGTHIYIAGNFSYSNIEPNPCGGTAPTDGEGIILDTLNGCQTTVTPAYNQQVAVVNNVTIFNGARGILVGGGCAGISNSLAHVYLKSNTAYGNNRDPNQNVVNCGDLWLSGTAFTELYQSIGATNSANGCGTNPIYGISVANGGATDIVYSSFAYSATVGQSTHVVSSPGFSFGPNLTSGADPVFANPVTPSAPSCSSFVSVPSCMAAIVANFTPTTVAARSYGYQIPATASAFDPLYPTWLCGVMNLPAGLVTPGCSTGSFAPFGVTFGAGASIH